MKSFLRRGVPRRVLLDAWWLGENARKPDAGGPDGNPPEGRAVFRRDPPFRLVALFALILLADWLFWGFAPGLSLVLFGLVIGAAPLSWLCRQCGVRSLRAGSVLLVLAILPVFEQMQLLSVLILAGGLFTVAGWAASMGDWRRTGANAARFMRGVPVRGMIDVTRVARDLCRETNMRTLAGAGLRAWVLPLVGGLLFLALFLQGNPIFEQALNAIPVLDPDLARILFWIMVGLLVWPFLSLPLKTGGPDFSVPSVSIPEAVLNPQSARNSLLVFNIMFLVQSGLDGLYLWGGVRLPDGMTMAAFAHRGAYPLVVTALLAGLFALMFRPYARRSHGLRWLLIAWLLQNLLLVASSVRRLQIYVESYGLTYLRVDAFVWMGLVAGGLGLVLVQILRRKGNPWLLGRTAAMLAVVLYICSFVNFANLIARFNLMQISHGAASHFDRDYVCGLGAAALPAILDYENTTGTAVCSPFLRPTPPETPNWREWGFRNWRLRRYLAGAETGKATGPRLNRVAR